LINKKYNTDYRIEKNPKEYSDIDCYAISDSSKFNNFDLQLVSSDREIPRLSVENTRRFKKGEHMIASNVDYKTWILKAIEDKENSYTPKLRNNLILLIEGCSPMIPQDLIEIEAQKYVNLSYKGVYYIAPPTICFPETKETKNGYIVSFKDCFEVLFKGTKTDIISS